jgi:NADPH:quinone reductase-like Zn-dependent oxidoreductase
VIGISRRRFVRAITQRKFGGPEVLEIRNVDRPTGLPTEVIVDVRAVGLNRIDAEVRSGASPLLGQPPFTLGWDISGVIDEVVPGVNRFKVGDEVYGMPLFPRPASAYAEYVAAPSRQLALKPAALDHVHAAAMPLSGLTAYQSLVDVADVRAGQRVLIHGAAGGVGHIAVQIAAARGAHVIATASAAKHDFIRDLGAHEVIDYRAVDFGKAVANVDVVLETVGRGYAERSLPVLRPGGLLVTIVERRNMELAHLTRAAGRRFAGVVVEPDHGGLEKLSELVESGHLRVHVEHVFRFAEAAQAHQHLTGRAKGKIVLTL